MTRKVAPFTTIVPHKVNFYMCGPTVYNYAHIGNFRALVAADILRRYLEYKGFEVNHVMNITDIDDKTIRDSQAEHKSLKDFTEFYTKKFFEDYDQLHLLRPVTAPKATDFIQDIIQMVQTLIDKGFAYEKDGNVYFSIEKSEGYGELVCLDKAHLLENADGRLNNSDEYGKENARDFAVWKAYIESDGDVAWESPWGKGRPGWHIECSAMSTKLLGNTFDIHGGGVDLRFPHHTNEIAQSEGATGKEFAKWWFHNEFLLVEGEKMSKSEGNFYTLRDILAKGYSGDAIRYLLFSTQYRQKINFMFAGLDAATKNIEKIKDFILRIQDMNGIENADEEILEAKSKFEEAMDNDLNMSGALASIFDFMKDINKKNLSNEAIEHVLETMYAFDTVLGLHLKDVKRGELSAPIEKLIEKRNEARKNKDWAESDKIRDELKAQGIELLDSATGTTWKKVNE